MIGATLGHYRIESQTGQGGMGVVYFPVWHFHEARRSPMGIALPIRGLALTRDRIALNLSESTGNGWMPAGDAPARAK